MDKGALKGQYMFFGPYIPKASIAQWKNTQLQSKGPWFDHGLGATGMPLTHVESLLLFHTKKHKGATKKSVSSMGKVNFDSCI